MQFYLLIPFQPNIFNRLSIDANKRIKVLVMSIHAVMVTSLRKKIAPTLKDILGPWFNGIFDPNSEVSRLAFQSFQVNFLDISR